LLPLANFHCSSADTLSFLSPPTTNPQPLVFSPCCHPLLAFATPALFDRFYLSVRLDLDVPFACVPFHHTFFSPFSMMRTLLTTIPFVLFFAASLNCATPPSTFNSRREFVPSLLLSPLLSLLLTSHGSFAQMADPTLFWDV